MSRHFTIAVVLVLLVVWSIAITLNPTKKALAAVPQVQNSLQIQPPYDYEDGDSSDMEAFYYTDKSAGVMKLDAVSYVETFGGETLLQSFWVMARLGSNFTIIHSSSYNMALAFDYSGNLTAAANGGYSLARIQVTATLYDCTDHVIVTSITETIKEVTKISATQGIISGTKVISFYSNLQTGHTYSLEGKSYTYTEASVSSSPGYPMWALAKSDFYGSSEFITLTYISISDMNQDHVAPTTNVSLTGTVVGNGWYKSQVRVTLSAIDNGQSPIYVYGLAGTGYRFDNDAVSMLYFGPFNVTMEGKHTLYYYSFDKAGNVETEKNVSIWIDTQPPSAPALDDGINFWTNSNTTIMSWPPVSDTSGIASYIWGFSWEYTARNSTTSTSVHTPPALDGTHTFEVQAVDNAGWKGIAGQHTYGIDTVPPMISIETPTQGQILAITSCSVEWTISDNLGSGIGHSEVKLDSANWINKGLSATHVFSSVSNGNHQVQVRVFDNAGNSKTETRDFSINSAQWQPAVESSDHFGNKKDSFAANERVYATGTGFTPSTTYDIYVVADVNWNEGMIIPAREYGTSTTLTSDGTGAIPLTVVWNQFLNSGKHDIIVDVDGDGKYNNNIDALDDNEVNGTAGFIVTSAEVPPGILEGTVFDASATIPLEGATVTAGDKTNTTDITGHYQLELNPGMYDVRVEKTRYLTQIESSIVVVSGASTTQDFSLVYSPMTIESCNISGFSVDTFNQDGTVFVKGDGYTPSGTYDLYVVADGNWTDGMTIPTRVPGTTTTVDSDSLGNLLPTIAWNNSLVIGKYDIVIDVNGNGRYDVGVDALDDNDVQVTAGLQVIPELIAYAVMPLFMAATFVALKFNKKRKATCNPND